MLKFKKLDYRYYIGIILIAIALVFGTIYVFRAPESAEASWFNDAWYYRQTISITNSSTAQTNTQVKILEGEDLSSLVSAGKLQSDLDDLRFTDVNGNILKYWIEDSTNSSVDIWAFIPSVPADGATIYMYYGNSSSEAGKSILGTSDYPGVSCEAIRLSGVTTDGVYYIDTDSEEISNSFQAYCDMTIDGGGWTLVEKDYGGSNIVPQSSVDDVNTDVLLNTSWSTAEGKFSDVKMKPIFKELLWKRSNGQYIKMRYTEDFIENYWFSNFTYSSRPSGIFQEYYRYSDSTWYAINGHSNNWHYSNYNDGMGSPPFSDDRSARDQNDNLVYWPTRSNGLMDDQNLQFHMYLKKDSFPVSLNISITSPSTEEKGPGPIAYWSFDEGYGTTAHDSTSNRNDGTLINMTTTGTSTAWVDGKVGKALEFDGVGGYVDVGDINLSGSDFSFSAWVKNNITPVSSYDFVYSSGRGGTSQGWWNIYFDLSSDLGVQFDDGTTSVSCSSISFPQKEWHYITTVFNIGDSVDIYVDGTKVKSCDISSVGSVFNNSEDDYIGKRNGSDSALNGQIDEVRLYDYALTTDQIKKLYNTKSKDFTGMNLSSSKQDAQNRRNEGLVGFWKMDEESWDGSTDEIIDYSGNENHCKSYCYDAGGCTVPTTTSTARYFRGADMNGSYLYQGPVCDNILDGQIEFSMSAWIKTTQLEGSSTGYVNPAILGSAHGSGFVTNDFSLLNKNGYLSWWDEFQGAYQGAYETDAYISDDEWHHVAMSRVNEIEGDDKTVIYLYADGVQVGSFETGEGAIEKLIRLGWSYSNTDIDGVLDHVKIWKRALAPQEISEEYVEGPDPVGYWSMDKIDGTTVIDESGNGNDGTLTNMTKSDNWKPGKVGQGLEFNGSNTYTYVVDDDVLDITSVGSWGAWIKADSSTATNRYVVMSKGYSYTGSANWSNSSYSIEAVNGGFNPHIYTNDGLGNYSYTGLSKAIPSYDEWHHVLVTFDSGLAKMYLNGVLVDTDTTTYNQINSISQNVFFGRHMGAYYFDGQIDEVKVWNYALTSYQVAQEYNQGGPVGYWSFDEGQGSTAHDFSSQGNDGTLTNMSTTGTSTAWVDGKYGKALRFDGVDDYVGISGLTAEGTQDYSLIFNFKTKDIGTGDNGIIGSNSGGINVYTNSANKLVIGKRGVNDTSITPNSFFNNNTWYHVAIIRQGTNLYTYIDNVLVSQTTDSNDYTTPISSIGSREGSSYLDGSLDEVKIFNYALTPVDVQQEYNSRSGQKTGLNLSKPTQDETNARADGLVGYWKLDEASWSGNTDEVIDYSGNGNHGTAQDGATTTSTAKFGLAFGSDALDDRVHFDSTDDLEYRGENFTIGCWLKINDLNKNNYIISKPWNSSGQYNYWLIYHSSQNGIRLRLSGESFYDTGHLSLTDNDWHYLTATIDSDRNIKLYLDGVLKINENHTITNWTPPSGDANKSLVLGAVSYSSPDWSARTDTLDGQLDEVKIWNRTLSKKEIEKEYNNSLAPIGYWSMDQIDGTTIIDQSGRGNNCTMDGGLTKSDSWKSGEVGQSILFENVNGSGGSHLECGNDSSLDITGSFTIEQWVKPNSFTYYPIFMRKGEDRYRIGLRGDTPPPTNTGDGRIYFRNTIEGSLKSLTSATYVPLNEWSHIVGVYDGEYMKIYINGILDDNVLAVSGSVDTDTSQLIIGSYSTGGNYTFDGYIDEVKLYDYALSPYQVAQAYNDGAPVGYWSFDEGEGSTAHDNTSNRNDGTLTNMDSEDWLSGSDCIEGGCLDFDGTDDWVVVDDDSVLEELQDWSISTWVRLETIAEKSFFARAGSLVFYYDNGNSLRITVWDSGGSQACNAVLYKSLEADRWYNFVVTGDADSGVSFYIDGVLEEKDNCTWDETDNTSASWYIGSYGALMNLDGQMDELKIYNYALTTEGVKEEYNLGKGIYFTP